MRPIVIATSKSDKNNSQDTKYEGYTLQNSNGEELQQIKTKPLREARKEHNRKTENQLQ